VLEREIKKKIKIVQKFPLSRPTQPKEYHRTEYEIIEQEQILNYGNHNLKYEKITTDFSTGFCELVNFAP